MSMPIAIFVLPSHGPWNVLYAALIGALFESMIGYEQTSSAYRFQNQHTAERILSFFFCMHRVASVFSGEDCLFSVEKGEVVKGCPGGNWIAT
jgi:hypothetical protein